MGHKCRYQMAGIAFSVLLAPLLASAQQSSPGMDNTLRQQAVQTCANIRQGLFSVASAGSQSEIEGDNGVRYRLEPDAQRRIIRDFPKGFENPDMQKVMENVIDRYQRTGRIKDLKQSAMNDEIYMIPCTEIHFRKFKAMTNRFADPQFPENGPASEPAMVTGHQRSVQPPTQYSEPYDNTTPTTKPKRSHQPRQNRLPQQDYGTGRR